MYRSGLVDDDAVNSVFLGSCDCVCVHSSILRIWQLAYRSARAQVTRRV